MQSVSKGDSSRMMAKHSYRTATVAVIETGEHVGGGGAGGADGGSLQLAPGGVSLTGTKQSSIEVLSAAGASLATGRGMTGGAEGEGVAGDPHHPVVPRQESDELEPVDVPHEDDEEEVAQGLTARQKSMLGFIWCASKVYLAGDGLSGVLNLPLQSMHRVVSCNYLPVL